MTTPLSEERDLTNIDRLRIGALHVEPPFADEDLLDEDLLDEITALESELERLRARNAELVAVLREVEWVEPEPTPRAEAYCLWCEAVCDDHAPDCALDAALRGANE